MVSDGGAGTLQEMSGAGGGKPQPSFGTRNPPGAAVLWGPGTAGPARGTAAGTAGKVAYCM